MQIQVGDLQVLVAHEAHNQHAAQCTSPKLGLPICFCTAYL